MGGRGRGEEGIRASSLAKCQKLRQRTGGGKRREEASEIDDHTSPRYAVKRRMGIWEVNDAT